MPIVPQAAGLAAMFVALGPVATPIAAADLPRFDYRASTVCTRMQPVDTQPRVVVHAIDFLGSPLPGAEVRVESEGGTVRSGRTDGAGRAVIERLPAARFSVEISQAGFVPARLAALNAEPQCTIAITAPLEVGSLGDP